MGMTKEKNWEMTTGGGGPNIHSPLSSSGSFKNYHLRIYLGYSFSPGHLPGVFYIVIFGHAPLLKQRPAPGVYSTRFSK